MINLLFFANIKEIVGTEQMQMDIANVSVLELKKKLSDTYGIPNLSAMMVSVNEEFETDDTMIQSGDTVAIIPPVSGG